MHRLRGLKSLVHDAVDHTVDLVALGHASAARRAMAVLEAIPPLAAPARFVDDVRRIGTAAVLGTVKGVNRVVAAASDLGLDAVSAPVAAVEPLVPLRSDALGTPLWMADAALGLANGAVGDHLEERRNGLDLGLVLRGLDAWIAPDGTGIPADASPRLVVLVHGLGATEWSWCLDAARNLGDPAANLGTLLQRDLGFTPVFARYNSGRHISHNGRALSARLDELVAAWPHPVEEVVLIGHSMGGLVVRSACHHGHEAQAAWVGRVRRAVTIASPLQGARLERFGNVAATVLGTMDLPATAIPARLINGRSAGIKDLRYGYVRDAEWIGVDPDALLDDHRRDVPLPAHIRWCFLVATLPQSVENPVSRALGDLLVHVQSASGPADAPQDRVWHHVGGVDHARVATHPAVYERVRDFCSTGSVCGADGVALGAVGP